MFKSLPSETELTDSPLYAPRDTLEPFRRMRKDEAGRYRIDDLYEPAATCETRSLRPLDWCSLDRTKALAQLLVAEGSAHPPIQVQGDGVYVAWELAYDYAMRISPAFKSQVLGSVVIEQLNPRAAAH